MKYDAKTTDQIENGIKELLMTVNPRSLRPRWQEEAPEEKPILKIPIFQIRSDLLDRRGVLKLPKDGTEPHPGSITDKRLTVCRIEKATK